MFLIWLFTSWFCFCNLKAPKHWSLESPKFGKNHSGHFKLFSDIHSYLPLAHSLVKWQASIISNWPTCTTWRLYFPKYFGEPNRDKSSGFNLPSSTYSSQSNYKWFTWCSIWPLTCDLNFTFGRNFTGISKAHCGVANGSYWYEKMKRREERHIRLFIISWACLQNF